MRQLRLIDVPNPGDALALYGDIVIISHTSTCIDEALGRFLKIMAAAKSVQKTAFVLTIGPGVRAPGPEVRERLNQFVGSRGEHIVAAVTIVRGTSFNA